MAGEKRFGTALFGFKRSDVNSYFEKILREFDDKLKDKDNEILFLKSQNREWKAKNEELSQKMDMINEERVKVAEALMRAQEKADIMLEDAKLRAAEEKKRLQDMVEAERERYVGMKEELRILRTAAMTTLKNFEMQLNEIIDTAASTEVKNS